MASELRSVGFNVLAPTAGARTTLVEPRLSTSIQHSKSLDAVGAHTNCHLTVLGIVAGHLQGTVEDVCDALGALQLLRQTASVVQVDFEVLDVLGLWMIRSMPR